MNFVLLCAGSLRGLEFRRGSGWGIPDILMSKLDQLRIEPPIDHPDETERVECPSCGYLPCICNEDTDMKHHEN